MRPALVLISAALALFLLVKGIPYLLVQAEALATDLVFTNAWNRTRGVDRSLADAAQTSEPERPWRLTAARPIARLSVPRLGSAAVIATSGPLEGRGLADFLLTAPSLTTAGAHPLEDAMRAGHAFSADMFADARIDPTGTVHARGVEDSIIIDGQGRSLRFLPDLLPGDLLELESVDGRVYRYQVTGTRVALSLQPAHKINADLIKDLPELTLVAPYPLNDLSPSAFRYKVRANLVDLADR